MIEQDSGTSPRRTEESAGSALFTIFSKLYRRVQTTNEREEKQAT
jgi:hypothetical protein